MSEPGETITCDSDMSEYTDVYEGEDSVVYYDDCGDQYCAPTD